MNSLADSRVSLLVVGDVATRRDGRDSEQLVLSWSEDLARLATIHAVKYTNPQIGESVTIHVISNPPLSTSHVMTLPAAAVFAGTSIATNNAEPCPNAPKEDRFDELRQYGRKYRANRRESEAARCRLDCRARCADVKVCAPIILSFLLMPCLAFFVTVDPGA